MVQYLEKYKKNIAIDLRKRGFSYSEIQSRVKVPKSTLSTWLREVPISEDQEKKLNDRMIEVARANSQKRTTHHWNESLKVTRRAVKEIGPLSLREKWLMGVMLYWRDRITQRGSSDFTYGVRFTTGDPAIAWFFIMWLREIGKIKKTDLKFDIFLKSKSSDGKKRSVAYWSKITGFSSKNFTRIYTNRTLRNSVQNENTRTRIRKAGSPYGLLRIRVKESTLLAHQIFGWVSGIQNNL